MADQQLSDAKALVEESPKSADAWEQLASAYAGTEDFDQAIAAATKASALDPNSFRRLQTLVSLQIRQNKTDDAINVVQKYSASHPENADALPPAGAAGPDRRAHPARAALVPDVPAAGARQPDGRRRPRAAQAARRELVLRGARTGRSGRSPPRAPLLGSFAGR